MNQRLYQIADELRAIASAGLSYSDNGYDRERYGHVLKLSAGLLAVLEHGSFEEIYAQYQGNLAHLSPLLAVEAVVFREEKILLIQRRDNQLWALPGGLAEVGESPAHAAERELWEEAGLQGKAIQLLALYDSRSWPLRSRMQLCTAQFLIRTDDYPAIRTKIENEISPLSESLNVGFFDPEHLPALSYGHELRIPMALKLMNGEVSPPYFDR